MNWVILSLLRAVFESGKEATIKLSLSQQLSSVTISAVSVRLVSVLILVPYIIWDGSWQSIENSKYAYAIFGNVAFNTVAYLLLLTTIRRFDISYVAAILAASPLVFGVFSILFLGDNPGLYAFFFMGFIAVGSIFVELSRDKVKDFKNFLRHSGWIPLCAYLLLAAGATTCSKIAVTNGDPEAYIAYRQSGLIIIFYIVHLIYESHWGITLLKRKRDPIVMRLDYKALLAGLFALLAVICEMNALRLTDMARVESITKFSIVMTLMIDTFFISKNVSWKRWFGVFLILIGGLGILLV